MGLINFTPITDGSTAVASQVNTPLQTIYNEFNGNIAAANLASNAVTSPKLDPTVNPETRDNERFFDHVPTGLLWSIVSGLNGTMSSGVVYIAGVRIPVGAVASRAFTASKDTYVDVNNTGTIVYTEVANNASSPSLAANSVRLSIGITSGAAITQFNVGQESATAPVVSSVTLTVTDTSGNLICPRDPNRRLLGYRQIASGSGFTTTNITQTQVTGLSVPITVPTGRKIKISTYADTFGNTAANSNVAILKIWDGVVGSGTQLTQTNSAAATSVVNGLQTPTYVELLTTPTSSSKTFNLGLSINVSGTATFSSVSTPVFIKVELV